MNPSAQSSPGAAPLPPLPSPVGSGGPSGSPTSSGMQDVISGLGPVKMGVQSIVQACKSIVQSGAVPGAEQPCAQIVALAMSLIPMAAQSALSPGAGPSGGAVAPIGQGPQPLGSGPGGPGGPGPGGPQ